jgi:hypothetical protein
MSEEKEEGFIFTPKVEEEGLIKEFPSLDAQVEEVDAKETEVEPIKVETALLGSDGNVIPDIDLRSVKIPEAAPEVPKIPEAAPEVPKIPEAAPEVPDLVKQNQEVPEEKKELTEEEKKAKLIEAIKQAHIRYHPKKHFGVAYKQKRKAKNKMQKKSRKNSR